MQPHTGAANAETERRMGMVRSGTEAFNCYLSPSFSLPLRPQSAPVAGRLGPGSGCPGARPVICGPALLLYSSHARGNMRRENNGEAPTILTSETMSILAMSMFIPTATGAPVKRSRRQHNRRGSFSHHAKCNKFVTRAHRFLSALLHLQETRASSA